MFALCTVRRWSAKLLARPNRCGKSYGAHAHHSARGGCSTTNGYATHCLLCSVPCFLRELLPTRRSTVKSSHGPVPHMKCTAALKLKLRIFTLGKQLVHRIATCYPLARQTADGVVLARGVGAPLWNDESWKADSSRQGEPTLHSRTVLCCNP